MIALEKGERLEEGCLKLGAMRQIIGLQKVG